MKNLKFLALFVAATLTLTSCLHIVEEVTFKKNGSGNYKMNLDMSEMKSMMEMMKSMGGDSTATAEGGGGEEAEAAGGNEMTQMGEELVKVSESLKGVQGITNVQEMMDTATFNFGYSFDFENTDALNRAMKIVNKEKYDSKTDEIFSFKGGKFERFMAGDLGAEIKKQLSEGGEEEEAEQMEMVKMFFADMTYKQIYHFDQSVKKSTNKLSEISEDGKTVTITLKPFNEEQAKENPTVATEIKLK